MKLKYYLRGLGNGIIVTALLMGVALGGKQSLSEEEIKERAVQLGMVEESPLFLGDIQEQDDAVPTAEASQTAEMPENPETMQGTAETQDVLPEQEANEASETAQTQETVETQESAGESAVIEIRRGDSSVSVSKSLAEAGLVPDAAEYDRFLCEGGYDKSISIGTFEIPVGSSGEEIAKIITKRK